MSENFFLSVQAGYLISKVSFSDLLKNFFFFWIFFEKKIHKNTKIIFFKNVDGFMSLYSQFELSFILDNFFLSLDTIINF